MRQKTYRKRMLSLALGLCLVFGQTAYAEITIVPMPWETGSAQSGLTSGNGVYGPGAAGGLTGLGPGTAQSGQTGAGTGTSQDSSSVSGTDTAPASQSSGTETASQTTDSTASAQQLTEPTVSAEGAVLMDASTGQVLFGKNQDTQFYPASITKVMTALLVLERCSLSDVVTFSSTATTNLESGAVSLNITEGDQLTVEQALYGLLLKSANEIGNGLAEHVAGSVSGFAGLMNEKAVSLGCKNTHFANPHGLNDSTHKTTPYDMALILRAALQNDTFRKIDTTLTYEFPATKKAAARTITMGHKMMYPSDSRYYEGIIGGKTGYTSLAGNTLVTGAERNGVRLIAVVMKSKGTHYTDTKAMLDYGFENYAELTAGNSASSGSGTSAAGAGQNAVAGPSTGAQSSTGTSAAPSAGTQSSTGTSAAPSAGAQSNTGTSAGPSAGTQSSTGTSAAPSAAQTGAGVSSGPSASTQSSVSTETGWHQAGERWYYIKEDGQRAAGEWLTLSGLDYWFDEDGYMATGWRKFTNGSWYYFRPSTGYAVKSGWVQDGGNWYYLGADGVLLTNTTTPDGYQVNGDGIWIQE